MAKTFLHTNILVENTLKTDNVFSYKTNDLSAPRIPPALFGKTWWLRDCRLRAIEMNCPKPKHVEAKGNALIFYRFLHSALSSFVY